MSVLIPHPVLYEKKSRNAEEELLKRRKQEVRQIILRRTDGVRLCLDKTILWGREMGELIREQGTNINGDGGRPPRPGETYTRNCLPLNIENALFRLFSLLFDNRR